MTVKVVVGCQWGDEGKGKLVDVYTAESDIVARYQGGANAGHTVVVGEETFVLHLVPSGIIHKEKHKKSIIGPGVVLDPKALMNEFKYLDNKNIDLEDRLFIDGRTHLILPYHRIKDVAQERIKKRGGNAIGTTARGIGPSYTDKTERTGLRVMDLLNENSFEENLKSKIDETNRYIFNLCLNSFDINDILRHLTREEVRSNQDLIEKGLDKTLLDYTKYGNDHGIKSKQMLEDLLRIGNKLKPHIADTSIIINNAIAEGKNVLFEGAQGTFLDLNYGTYPFVTSSNPIAGGACVGLGVGPTKIDEVVGIVKAYTTRVGEGPFPTEFKDQLIDQVRKQGNEVGASTGRERRCGYFDAVMTRTAAYLNGLTSVAITKLDVLTGISPLKICTAYKVDGTVHKTFPLDLESLSKAEPIYEEMSGWTEDISGARTFQELPNNAKVYVTRIRQLMRESPGGKNINIKEISVGPKRSEIIRL